MGYLELSEITNGQLHAVTEYGLVWRNRPDTVWIWDFDEIYIDWLMDEKIEREGADSIRKVYRLRINTAVEWAKPEKEGTND